MLLDATLAYLHFISLLTLASALGAEALLLRANMGASTVRSLVRADILYGISSGLVLVTGLARLFYGAKGHVFYTSNPVFWIKVGLFAVIGLLSIYPTARFLSWRKLLNDDASYLPPPTQAAAVRRLVFVELHLLTFVPLAAVLMARGWGMGGN